MVVPLSSGPGTYEVYNVRQKFFITFAISRRSVMITLCWFLILVISPEDNLLRSIFLFFVSSVVCYIKLLLYDLMSLRTSLLAVLFNSGYSVDSLLIFRRLPNNFGCLLSQYIRFSLVLVATYLISGVVDTLLDLADRLCLDVFAVGWVLIFFL